MSFFTLTKKQISLLSGILFVTLITVLVHSFAKTKWSTFFSDPETGYIIKEVMVPTVIPITDDILHKTLKKEAHPASSVAVKIHNYNNLGVFEPRPAKFSSQLTRNLQTLERLPNGNLIGMRYLFYFDVQKNALEHINKPTLFFDRLSGLNWQIYFNDQLIGEGDSQLSYLGFRLPASKLRESNRVVFVIENMNPQQLSGLWFQNGLSIRSAEDVAWAQRTLPMQHQLPRIIAAIFFLCFSVFSVVLAFSMPRFTDLWSLAAFCGAMFFAIWLETPFYWEAYDFNSTGGHVFTLVRGISHVLVVLTASCLSLSFFRIKGYYLWLILGLTFLWCGYSLHQGWPFGSTLPLFKLYAVTDAPLVRALWSSQLIIFLYGFYSLYDQYKHFQSRGLQAMLPAMKRRFGEASIFTFAMSAMVAAYLIGLPLQSMTSGPDLFLLFALAPATVIFIQFYWMMGASTRFREKLVPQLDYVDYVVMELGPEAMDKPYQGVMAAFDLKGFKKITDLKRKSPAHAKAVDHFIATMRSDIARLVCTGRTIFRYKSNGDEWIFALFAKNQPEAQSTFVEVARTWSNQAAALMSKWKQDLIQKLGNELDRETAEVVNYLDLHVMMCVMNHVYINVENSDARPDFTSDSFTMLTQAFKHSQANAIAMYEKEATLFIEQSQIQAAFEPSSDIPHTGLLRLSGDLFPKLTSDDLSHLLCG